MSSEGGAVPELTKEELAKLSKEERKAYHEARLKTQQEGKEKLQLTKEQRRAIQESQRKAKEDKQQAVGENKELLEELKLQGLSEEQAREVMAELLKNEGLQEQDEEEDDEVEDLLESVRKWVQEQPEGKVPADALRDFNMKVRFQGHVESTPPDHLGCLMHVLVEDACKDVDFAAPKLQPSAVAKKVGPIMTRWEALIDVLYKKIDDVLVSAEVVLRAVSEGVMASHSELPADGQAIGAVGCLMALRETDIMEDEDLLAGCRAAELKHRIMDKFIEFLEDALEDEDEDAK